MIELESNSERKMNRTTKTTSATARRSNSNSSSSGESSSEDDGFQIDTSMFEVNFQMDAMKFNNSFQIDSPKFIASGALIPASKQGKNYVSSSENSAKLSEVDNRKPPVPRPTFQAHDLTNYQKNDSLITSPPVQVMDRSRGYEPGRIPASIFERHNGTPLEWSVCSNDSLFSLNLGNSSLSRENANAFGELAMSEELSKSSEPNSFSRIPSIIMEETDSATESFNSENMQGSDISHTASKSLEERLNEEQIEGKYSLQTPSSKSSKFVVSSLSHGSSANSAQSSTSPVSDSQSMRNIPFMECKKKRARSLCNCSNCNWTFCCSWPSCNCKCLTSGWAWPNCNCNCKCSTCGWACCNCWNYCCSLTKGSGHHASPILTEAERKYSVEDDIPPKQSSLNEKKQEVHSKFRCGRCCNWRSCCNWFHCFSCSFSCCRWRPSCRWKPCCTTIRCKFCC